MTPREPSHLPQRFDCWEDWRASYDEFRTMYMQREIDRPRLRVLFAMLGFTGHDLEAELNEALQQRGKS